MNCTGDSNPCATVTDFSFTDGVTTLSMANGAQFWSNANLSTAADGSINNWSFLFESASAYTHSGGNQTGGWLTGDQVMGVYQTCNSYSDGVGLIPCPVVSITVWCGKRLDTAQRQLKQSGQLERSHYHSARRP